MDSLKKNTQYASTITGHGDMGKVAERNEIDLYAAVRHKNLSVRADLDE